MYCSKCGSSMKEDANFCLHCGGKKEDSPANILVEPIVESEKPLKIASEPSQNSWKDYTTSQDMGGTIPDVDPSLFDLDRDHMDREKQEPEKKIDLGAGLDFGTPRQSVETMPPLNAEPLPTPVEPQTLKNSPAPPTFVAPSFPIAPDIASKGKPINLQPKVVGTYYSDKIPQGFVLDNSSGLYFKSINKIDSITNQIIEEVTYYNDATKEVSVVVYPKEQPMPAPPIMGYSVHSTAAQDASRNKSNSWIVIVIVILVVALLIAVIAGVIGFAGSKGSRRDNNTSSKTSSSVLESGGNRQRNSSQEESAQESAEVPYDASNSFYGPFASFDGDTFAYKNGNQIIYIPYKSGVLGESYPLDNVEEAYGMADGVILFSNSIFDIETSGNTVFKKPIESEHLMQSSLFDEAITDYNYIY